MRAATARVNDVGGSGRSAGRLPLAILALGLHVVLRRPRDSLAAGIAGFAAIAILVNALFMQSGPHPAPIFANKSVPVVAPLPGPAAAPAPPPTPPHAPKDVGRPRAPQVAPRHPHHFRRGFY